MFDADQEADNAAAATGAIGFVVITVMVALMVLVIRVVGTLLGWLLKTAFTAESPTVRVLAGLGALALVGGIVVAASQPARLQPSSGYAYERVRQEQEHVQLRRAWTVDILPKAVQPLYELLTKMDLSGSSASVAPIPGAGPDDKIRVFVRPLPPTLATHMKRRNNSRDAEDSTCQLRQVFVDSKVYMLSIGYYYTCNGRVFIYDEQHHRLIQPPLTARTFAQHLERQYQVMIPG